MGGEPAVTLLLVVLLLAIVLSLPQWPYTRRYEWGYWPSSLLFVIVVILLIYLLVPGAWRAPVIR